MVINELQIHFFSYRQLTTHSSLDSLSRPLLSNISLSLFKDSTVTAVPDAVFEVEMPLGIEFQEGEEGMGLETSVTEVPEDAVTVQYFIEGEEVRIKATSNGVNTME